MISRIIHQIWLGSDLPAHLRRLVESWRTYNPSWEYILWDEDKLSKIKLQHRKLVDRTDCYGIQSDIIRCELLYQFGGVYVDTDFECLRPIDDLIACPDDCRECALLGNFGSRRLENSFLASSPQHPFFKLMLDRLPKSFEHYRAGERGSAVAVQATGPHFLTKAYRAYANPTKASMLVASKYIFPFGFKRLLFMTEINLHEKYPDAYAAHHWAHSWIQPKCKCGRKFITHAGFRLHKKRCKNNTVSEQRAEKQEAKPGLELPRYKHQRHCR